MALEEHRGELPDEQPGRVEGGEGLPARQRRQQLLQALPRAQPPQGKRRRLQEGKGTLATDNVGLKDKIKGWRASSTRRHLCPLPPTFVTDEARTPVLCNKCKSGRHGDSCLHTVSMEWTKNPGLEAMSANNCNQAQVK